MVLLTHLTAYYYQGGISDDKQGYLITNGDMIISLDNQDIDNVEDLENIMEEKNVGDEVNVGENRNGDLLRVTVRLDPLPHIVYQLVCIWP